MMEGNKGDYGCIMSKTLGKDILLICKGYYNKEKYKSVLEAFNAYYHTEYLCEDITMDEGFAIQLFLKPCVKEFLKEREVNWFCENYLFKVSMHEIGLSHDRMLRKKEVKEMSFDEVLYYRLISWLCCLQVKDYNNEWIIDLSDYHSREDGGIENIV